MEVLEEDLQEAAVPAEDGDMDLNDFNMRQRLIRNFETNKEFFK